MKEIPKEKDRIPKGRKSEYDEALNIGESIKKRRINERKCRKQKKKCNNNENQRNYKQQMQKKERRKGQREDNYHRISKHECSNIEPAMRDC